MELILKSNDENSLAKIINLAKELHVVVEKRNEHRKNKDAESSKKAIRDFKAIEPSSRENASEWQTEERADRDLPFRQ